MRGCGLIWEGVGGGGVGGGVEVTDVFPIWMIWLVVIDGVLVFNVPPIVFPRVIIYMPPCRYIHAKDMYLASELWSWRER